MPFFVEEMRMLELFYCSRRLRTRRRAQSVISSICKRVYSLSLRPHPHTLLRRDTAGTGGQILGLSRPKRDSWQVCFKLILTHPLRDVLWSHHQLTLLLLLPPTHLPPLSPQALAMLTAHLSAIEHAVLPSCGAPSTSASRTTYAVRTVAAGCCHHSLMNFIILYCAAQQLLVPPPCSLLAA